MATMRIIRKDIGTFLKTDEPKKKPLAKVEEIVDGRELVEREFERFNFDNEEKRRKFIDFVFHVRSQVKICHSAGFALATENSTGSRCGINNGLYVIYNCGPGFKPKPCEYMILEKVITPNIQNKNKYVVTCIAHKKRNA